AGTVGVIILAVVVFLLMNLGRHTDGTLTHNGETLQQKPLKIAPLDLRVAVLKRHGNTVSVLKEGESLTAEDAYGALFEPAQETVVYVLQQDATGKLDVLFPDPKVTKQTNPVPSGKIVWVPQDETHWFYLDQNKGREVIFVAASLQRDEKLEAMLRSISDP